MHFGSGRSRETQQDAGRNDRPALDQQMGSHENIGNRKQATTLTNTVQQRKTLHSGGRFGNRPGRRQVPVRMIRTAVIGREGLTKLPQTFQIIGQDRESPALARQRFHANHSDRFSPVAAAPRIDRRLGLQKQPALKFAGLELTIPSVTVSSIPEGPAMSNPSPDTATPARLSGQPHGNSGSSESSISSRANLTKRWSATTRSGRQVFFSDWPGTRR